MASVEELILRISQQGGQSTERQLRSIRSAIQEYARGVNQSAVRSITFAQGLQQVSQSLGNVGRNLTNYVTKNLIKVAAGSIKTAATFEQGMSRVKAVTGATGKDFTTMRNLALDMGSKTTKTATEAAQAIEYMGLAGWNTKQIQEGLEPVLRASEAGMMDLGLTSDLVTDSMASLGIGTKDLTRYLDIGAKAQSSSNQSMQQYLEAMLTGGGILKAFNIPLEEGAAIFGKWADQGIKGSEAGNALISIMANLTTGTGQAGDAMKGLGVKVYDENGKFKGLTNIIKELNAKFKGMTQEQKNTFQQMIGGKVRFEEFYKLLATADNGLEKMTKSLYNADGSLSKMAKTMQDNLMGEWTKFKSAIEGISIQIGSAFLPYLRQGVKWLQSLAEGFKNIGPGGQLVIVIMAAIAAAIGPLLLLLAGIGSAIANIVIAVNILAPILGGISAPIVAIVGAITLLLPALIGLLLSSERVRDGIGNAFGSIKDKIGSAIGFIKTHIDDIKAAFQGLLDFVTTGNFDQSFENMRQALKNMFPGKSKTIDDLIMKFVDFRQKVINIRDALIDFGTRMITALEPIKETLMMAFRHFKIEPIISAFKNLMVSIQPLLPVLKTVATILGIAIATSIGITIAGLNAFIAAIDNVVGLIINAIGIIINIVGILVGTIVALFTGNEDMVINSIKSLWENVKGLFKNAALAILGIVGGFADGIVGFFKWLYNIIVGHSIIPDMVKAIINWFKNLWNSAKNIFSNIVSSIVSKVMSVKNRAVSLFNSMRASISNVLNALRSIAANAFSRVVSAISSKISAAKSAASRVANAAKNGIKTIVSGVYAWGANMVNNIIKGIYSKLGAVRNAASKVASTIKSFLGFSSPTEEGPGKDADKWTPNLINMIKKDMEEGIFKIKNAAAGLAAQINFVPQQGNAFPNTSGTINNINVSININGAKMSTDEIGRSVVSALISYGIRPQKG